MNYDGRELDNEYRTQDAARGHRAVVIAHAKSMADLCESRHRND